MASSFRHALVIGASSGIGEALARRLGADGARVAVVARRQPELERIAAEIDAAAGGPRTIVRAHDVRNTHEVPELFQGIARELGGLDLVVYAAGTMPRVAFDEFDPAKDLDMLAVNLAGAVAWLDPAAERFSRLGRGTIVGIGSVAGDRGRSGNPVYGTSKAGLHTYLEALRNRVARDGVRVVTIKPGFVDTAMTRGVDGLFWLISADRAAEIILSRARRGVVCAYVPARWRLVMWVIRAIPSVVFRRLKV
ncbi:MAG TPA: SDR family NAD(P)-dependent oxidoreductase [Candidatus Sulfomarinibacteraceae bacterium]|nr:SDR family NAD(P)-dependent oxidoreductase [Candidatus Sulfomarinibacteraceae bacterium]